MALLKRGLLCGHSFKARIRLISTTKRRFLNYKWRKHDLGKIFYKHLFPPTSRAEIYFGNQLQGTMSSEIIGPQRLTKQKSHSLQTL